MPSSSDVEKTERHPSFGMISVSKVSGRMDRLFGTSISAMHWVELEITGAEVQHALNRQWFFDRDMIVRVAMSEAQWATFVSSFNTSGVPCTIRRKAGEGLIEEPPPHMLKKEDFKADFEKRCEEVGSLLTAAERLLSELQKSASVKKSDIAKLVGLIGRAHTEIRSNMPFVQTSFQENIESLVEEAKVEVHAHMNAVVRDLGLRALALGQKVEEGPILALPFDQEPK